MNALTAETTVREFAAKFPTTQVRRAVQLCEAGTLTWSAVAALFERSLTAAVTAVKN